jgi:hypothetical protein
MSTIGQLVQEAMDLSDRGLLDQSFGPACTALSQTAQKAFDAGSLSAPDYQTFLRDQWRFIYFAGIPRFSELPADLPFRLRRAVPSFNVPSVLEEIIIFAVRQTLATHIIPVEISLTRMGMIEVKDDKLIFPQSLTFSLLGAVVFHPVNKDEKIPDRYWINIWDFKMFVSELWGREDLAERIMNVYL